MKEHDEAAFPRPQSEIGGIGLSGQDGMTLRDWFAGQFACHYPVHVSLGGIDDATADNLAKAAYQFADACLRVRKSGG